MSPNENYNEKTLSRAFASCCELAYKTYEYYAQTYTATQRGAALMEIAYMNQIAKNPQRFLGIKEETFYPNTTRDAWYAAVNADIMAHGGASTVPYSKYKAARDADVKNVKKYRTVYIGTNFPDAQTRDVFNKLCEFTIDFYRDKDTFTLKRLMALARYLSNETDKKPNLYVTREAEENHWKYQLLKRIGPKRREILNKFLPRETRTR